MSEEQINTSNDLIRWLKMLSLPRWARILLSLVMLLVMCSGVGLLAWAVVTGKTDLIASSVSVLTIGLPVGLIVVALVFGDGGAEKLRALTTQVLEVEVAAAIRQNLHSANGNAGYQNPSISITSHGCIAEYSIAIDARQGTNSDNLKVRLDFKLEVNVKKANFVVWLPVDPLDSKDQAGHLLKRYESCFFGASKEGYTRNANPIFGERVGYLGIVFIKELGSDFLLNPAERLYFTQDLAFFIRGLLNVSLTNE
jgi:hypothetical protein